MHEALRRIKDSEMRAEISDGLNRGPGRRHACFDIA
jgi:hypothetical protein